MSPEVIVKSTDTSVKRQREAAANRVITELRNQTPDGHRLLCSFDDEDWKPFKETWGAANRGFYKSLRPEPMPGWPPYVRNNIFVQNVPSRVLSFDDVIYLHGTTCSNEVGLTMTFAHELRHFIQHTDAAPIWAANTLISNLKSETRKGLGIRCFDIPHEREARITSRLIAERIHRADAVREYVDAKVADPWKMLLIGGLLGRLIL